MNVLKNASVIIGSLAILTPAASFGAGFQINEFSGKATGRAGAVFATIDDPSAVFYNPAGLTEAKGTQAIAGVTFIKPSGTYVGTGIPSTNPTGEQVEQHVQDNFVPVPFAYVSRELSEKAYVGFGFYLPYGLGLTWDDMDNWVGRTVIQDISLRTFFLTPAIALKLSDEVSVAVSVSLVPATLRLVRVLGAADNGQVLFPRTSPDGQDGVVELTGSAFGVGANAGIQATLVDHLKLGFAFRSAVGLDFEGNADFRLPDNVPPALEANFPDGGGSGEITLPHSFALGVGWDEEDWTAELSGNLTLWQSFDELRISFESGLPAPSSVSPRNWTAVPTIRAGGEYRFGDYAARLGFAYDVTPVPDEHLDPTLPDADRIIVTVGGGATFDPVSIDLGYMFLFFPERDGTLSVNFPATLYEKRIVHLIGLSVGVAL